MMTNHIRTLYRGHSYQVPSVAEGETTVSVSRLSLAVGSQCITSQVDEPLLFVDCGKAFSLQLTIATYDFLCGEDPLDVTFYLYREGQSEPLAEASARMYEFDNFMLDLPFEDGSQAYGNYFLLGERVEEMDNEHTFDTLNGHLCFPFTLLPDGSKMHHPMPVSAELVRTVPGREEILFSSVTHELRLRFSERIGGHSRFTVHCYTSGWKLMTSVDRLFASSRRSTSRITFRLDAGREEGPIVLTPWLYATLYRAPPAFFAEAHELGGTGLFVAPRAPRLVVMRGRAPLSPEQETTLLDYAAKAFPAPTGWRRFLPGRFGVVFPEEDRYLGLPEDRVVIVAADGRSYTLIAPPGVAW